MISMSAFEQSSSSAPAPVDELQLSRLQHAEYKGYQEGCAEIPGFHLWNLRHDIPGHPAGSTVAQSTLDRHLFGI